MNINMPLETLRHHVTGAIERGEREAIVEIGVALLNEESALKAKQDDIRQAEEKAASFGKQAGESAALWIIQDTWGGRVTRGEQEAAAAFLAAFDDGDFASLPVPPNLSGEFADDVNPASLMESCFGEDWQDDADLCDVQDDICSAWEIACEDAFWTTLYHSAESVLA